MRVSEFTRVPIYALFARLKECDCVYVLTKSERESTCTIHEWVKRVQSIKVENMENLFNKIYVSHVSPFFNSFHFTWRFIPSFSCHYRCHYRRPWLQKWFSHAKHTRSNILDVWNIVLFVYALRLCVNELSSDFPLCTRPKRRRGGRFFDHPHHYIISEDLYCARVCKCVSRSAALCVDSYLFFFFFFVL